MAAPTGSAVHEYRTDRRREWIVDRESLESVVTDKLRCSVSGEFGFRAGFDNTGSKQSVFYVMPASRARVCVRTFLCDRCRLHQSAVDVPIDLAIRVNDLVGIILRDDRNGFLFAPGGLEAKPRIGLWCLVDGLLAHRAHWVYRKSSPRLFGDCSRRLLRDRARWLFRHRFRRLLGD